MRTEQDGSTRPSLPRHGIPTAVFEKREAAQLTAAVLPGTGRRLRYRLGPDPDPRGFPILIEGRLAGHSRHFNEDLLAALNTVDALAAAPRDFASLLEALGGLALEHVDRIAVARLAETGG
jgi:hypothetical protein